MNAVTANIALEKVMLPNRKLESKTEEVSKQSNIIVECTHSFIECMKDSTPKLDNLSTQSDNQTSNKTRVANMRECLSEFFECVKGQQNPQVAISNIMLQNNARDNSMGNIC